MKNKVTAKIIRRAVKILEKSIKPDKEEFWTVESPKNEHDRVFRTKIIKKERR